MTRQQTKEKIYALCIMLATLLLIVISLNNFISRDTEQNLTNEQRQSLIGEQLTLLLSYQEAQFSQLHQVNEFAKNIRFGNDIAQQMRQRLSQAEQMETGIQHYMEQLVKLAERGANLAQGTLLQQRLERLMRQLQNLHTQHDLYHHHMQMLKKRAFSQTKLDDVQEALVQAQQTLQQTMLTLRQEINSGLEYDLKQLDGRPAELSSLPSVLLVAALLLCTMLGMNVLYLLLSPQTKAS